MEEDVFDWFQEKKTVEDKILKLQNKKDKLYQRVKDLSDIKIPLKNEQIRIVTERKYNAFEIASIIIYSSKIKEMYLSTYRLSDIVVYALIDLINMGYIKNATFIVSNFFSYTKMAEKWVVMLQEYAKDHENIKFACLHNHSKVLAIKTFNNNFYILEGSGNMSNNTMIEQYIMENDKKTFEFHKNWMDELIFKNSRESAQWQLKT